DRVNIPSGARTIDATGKFLTPGFIDTNARLSPLDVGLSLKPYESRFTDILIAAAQINLKHGVTTIRNAYGIPKPLSAARDAINSGSVVGPRLYVAGNIIGWGGMGSNSYSGSAGRGGAAATVWDEQMNDAIVQEAGEDLANLGPDSLRVMVRKYLDKGV